MSETHRAVDRLLQVMDRLRDPDTGCPWDLEQDFRSIAPYTIEEAHEVADAIEHGDPDHIREELGDLLFQVVFHARLGKEQGAFDFAAVTDGIAEKLIRRHPHVFDRSGEDAPRLDSQTQTANWEAIKAEERASAGATSVLDGVSRGLPALRRAVKLQKRAGRVGFDWPGPEEVFAKIREELDELEAELAGADPDRLEDELGDVLFAVANLARKLDVDPGSALRRSNHKFERRFRAMEAEAEGEGRPLDQRTLDEQEVVYRRVKAREG